MALTAERNTVSRSLGILLALLVGATRKIYGGALVAVGADGYARPASDTAGLVVMGRMGGQKTPPIGSTVDNTNGADGALTAEVQQGVFKWKNSAGHAVAQAHVGHVCYVEDDQTVASASNNSIVAGIVTEIDADGGIWVATYPSYSLTALVGYPWGGALEIVTGAGALSVAKRTSLIQAGAGAMALTLADGTQLGQRKTIAMDSTGGGTATVTIAHMIGRGLALASHTAAFNAAEDYLELEWDGTGWNVVWQNSVVLA